MKKIIAILIFVFLCVGCSMSNKLLEKPPEKPYPTKRVLNADFDTVWNKTLQAIARYPLTIIEKNSGIINTDWCGYTDSVSVSVWRGVLFGGQVEEEMPVEVQERLNILITRVSETGTGIEVIRYVKIRPYVQTTGGKGSWALPTSQQYTQTTSSTRKEFDILNKIEELVNE